MQYKVGIIGATGLVGKEILSLLEKSEIQSTNIFLFSSEKSIKEKIIFKNKKIALQLLDLDILKTLDFIFFAAGSDISKKIIPLLKNQKPYCIDMSSAFREEKDIPLIIPEINSHILNEKDKIIASPNCTTTILLMPLYNLHKEYKIKKIIMSSYQAASGGGKKLIDKLLLDTKNAIKNNRFEDYGFNLFLHESKLHPNRYSEEEIKIINETKKILDCKDILINPTCVRVPVIRAHSIAINVEFEKEFHIEKVYEILKKTKGIEIFEDYENEKFATPLLASKKNEVLVSRIRNDLTNPKALDIWAVGDQLLKGAALNGFQIFELLKNKIGQ